MATILRILGLSFIMLAVLISLSLLSLGDIASIPVASAVLVGLLIYLGLIGYFAFRHRKWRITRVEACVLAVLLWSFVPLPGALALMTFHEMRFIDGAFEAYSALTTTGASIFTSLEDVPNSVIMLRSLMQWVGGLLTLSIVVVILAPMQIGGLPADQATVINKETTVLHGRVDKPIMAIASVYMILTMACFTGLIFSHVEVFDAINLALSTVSSGGFVPTDTPISELGSSGTSFVLSVFMILAGTSIVWQQFVLNGRAQPLKIHRETYFYFLIVACLAITYAAVFFERAGAVTVLSPFKAIEEGIFTAASLVSTTGYEIRTGSFGVLPVTLVALIVFTGGCSFSTAGGISLYRIGGMLSHSVTGLTLLVYPSSVYAAKFGSQRYDLALIRGIWTFLFSAVLVIMVGTLILALQSSSFLNALSASLAAFSNMGAFYSTGWSETAQWQNYSQMPDSSKIVLCVLMILGRLYLLTLLTALNFTYWFRAR